MLALTDRQTAEYFRRSFTTADGLWFIKVEESLGFDKALDLDDEVWKILPKIQARMLKTMGNLGNGLDALRECVTTRLTLDGFAFEIEEDPAGNSLQVRVTDCPWHNLMVKSGRPLKRTALMARQVSRPMRSARARGPMGGFIPSFMTVSISSAVPTPW